MAKLPASPSVDLSADAAIIRRFIDDLDPIEWGGPSGQTAAYEALDRIEAFHRAIVGGQDGQVTG